MPSCPFCHPPEEIIVQNEHAVAIDDKHPVSRGHLLIIPKAHCSTVFELAPEQYTACFDLLRLAKELLERKYQPAGFNVIMNCGSVAGQTVPHAHIHLVPRHEGERLNLRSNRETFFP